MEIDLDQIADASPDRRTISTTAPAKINLVLAVDRARGDGMHPIASWMTPIDLVDELTLTRLEEDRLSRYAVLWHESAPVQRAIDWSITSDLAVRAHMALEEHAGRKLPVQMKLEKRIPVGGGLGGGSSNAAAMLLGVNELFDLAVQRETLAEMALSLGSDVPFFLAQGAAVVEDMGQVVLPAPAVGCDLVLVLPDFGCDTGAVYRAFDACPSGAFRCELARDLGAVGLPDPTELFNDLAAAAAGVQPRLGELLIDVARVSGATPHVSGSGSSVFLLCPGGPDAAAGLCADIEREIEGVRAIATGTCGG
jgi:4-diphosphocytidyl-2-C-methyl-D-erythritol kinase